MPAAEVRKRETRKRILAAAAAEIRRSGPDTISVASVMAKAGLTQGGFYAHFESKEDLVAKAVPVMCDEAYRCFLGETDGFSPALAISNFIDGYLSDDHRDHPERGCPLPSLSGELARLPASHAAFTAGVERVRHALAALLSAAEIPKARETAASMLAEMVGALAISRALVRPAESAAVLRASRTALRRRLRLRPPSRRVFHASG